MEVAVFVAQSYPALSNPVDRSPAGSSVCGILQARILEWVAMPSSRRSSRPRDWTRISWVSCIGRWILYHWVISEASEMPKRSYTHQHSQWVTGIKEHRANHFASSETTLVPSCSWALYGIKADARPLLKPLLCLASSPAFPASSPSFLKGFSWEHSFSKNPSLLICFSIT